MQELSGQCNGPLIVLHGGAGPRARTSASVKAATKTLLQIAKNCMKELKAKRIDIHNPRAVATSCIHAMEKHEHFNAGYGSSLQGDAQARLSASLMDGAEQRFSGVMLASHLIHPSLLAAELQSAKSRVLSVPGTELLARRMGLPVESAQSEARVKTWIKQRQTGSTFYDTVGCVVRTAKGSLASGTSTGGRGNEFPGRISDTATVAGNYASRFAAVSCTGIGEEIVDDALAARVETRTRDGFGLIRASHLCFDEALGRKRQYGWIGVDAESSWVVTYTTPSMVFVVCSLKDGILAHS